MKERQLEGICLEEGGRGKTVRKERGVQEECCDQGFPEQALGSTGGLLTADADADRTWRKGMWDERF